MQWCQHRQGQCFFYLLPQSYGSYNLELSLNLAEYETADLQGAGTISEALNLRQKGGSFTHHSCNNVTGREFLFIRE